MHDCEQSDYYSKYQWIKHGPGGVNDNIYLEWDEEL